MAWRRCPNKLGIADVEPLMQSYIWLDRFGVLPHAGGLLDQHPLFVAAVKLIERERSEIQREEARLAELKAKLKRHGK